MSNMGMRLSPILIPLIIGSVAVSFGQGKKGEKPIVIGVVRSASHPNLEADEKGFEKAMVEAGFKQNGHLIYDRQNAQNDVSKAESIARKFREDSRVTLIHSSAIIASRALVKEIKEKPIVFSCVTDPVAFGLVPPHNSSRVKPRTNVTGVSDRLPVSVQFERYTQFFPKAKKWGLIYYSGDSKSTYRVEEVRKTARKLGVELIDEPVSSPTEASQAAQFLAQEVHAFYVLLDRASLSTFEAVSRVCNEKKIPLFSSAIEFVPNGAVASYGIDYFSVGLSAGRMAVRILKGENPWDIPWKPVKQLTLVVNERAARAQGVVIPSHFLKEADRVIKEELGTQESKN